MSKGVIKTKPVAKQAETKPDPYANLSINELMDHITNTTEELQEVIRRLDDLTEVTDDLNQQVRMRYEMYLEEKQELEVHLTRVEEYVNRRKQLSTQLAGYSDAFKNRMD
jgi:uncharacterized coiled-coil DUF342 family protein